MPTGNHGDSHELTCPAVCLRGFTSRPDGAASLDFDAQVPDSAKPVIEAWLSAPADLPRRQAVFQVRATRLTLGAPRCSWANSQQTLMRTCSEHRGRGTYPGGRRG